MIKLIKKYFLILVLLMPLLGINIANAAPIPPQANDYGKSYAEWATAWLEWALSIPNATNPLFDTTGAYAAMGQSGKVWFLAGTTTKDPNAVAKATRNITIPNGTALFFPILNAYWVNLPEYGDDPWSSEQESFARSYVKGIQDTSVGVELTIDRKVVSHINDYRVASTVGHCNLPSAKDENSFGLDLKNNPYYCVSDGIYTLIPPLSVGKHTIHFKGTSLFWDPDFSLDVTYNITVEPKKKHRMEWHK
jgi:hypothetical protein